MQLVLRQESASASVELDVGPRTKDFDVFLLSESMDKPVFVSYYLREIPRFHSSIIVVLVADMEKMLAGNAADIDTRPSDMPVFYHRHSLPEFGGPYGRCERGRTTTDDREVKRYHDTLHQVFSRLE